MEVFATAIRYAGLCIGKDVAFAGPRGVQFVYILVSFFSSEAYNGSGEYSEATQCRSPHVHMSLTQSIFIAAKVR